VFERFTERARLVVVLAQDEARALRHNYIGTEHLLLGLLREEEGLAARALESFELSLPQIRADVSRIVGQGDEVATGMVPFTPRAKQVLELSLREALSIGHDDIDTEHILLGLVRENQGVASRIMDDYGATSDAVRKRILEMTGPSGHWISSPMHRLPPEAIAGTDVPGVGFFPHDPELPATTAWVELERPLRDRIRDSLPLVAGAGIFTGGLVAGWLIWA
jgi:Clp amino terminal domain, pathogenicity island component